MVGYDWDSFRVQLNANNLADKEYISACDYYCWYGNRRNVIASASYAW
jgi:iron complex outermembrane receptor protein